MTKSPNGIPRSAKPRASDSKCQIKESELKTDRGAVLGIGRVKIPKTMVFNFEIPLLSFVVMCEIEEFEGKKREVFIASCIHLGIDGMGKTDDEAIRDMIGNVCRFLYENFCNPVYKNTRWSNILRLFKADTQSSFLWDKYHTIQLMFAERGYTTDSYAVLQRRIDALNKDVKRLEKEVEKEKIKSAMKFEFVISKINEKNVDKNAIVATYRKPQITPTLFQGAA